MGKESGPSGKTAVHMGKDPMSRWAEKDRMPAGYVPPKATIIDEMLAGQKSPEDIAAAIVEEAYGPLKQFCFLPKGFTNKVLGYERRGITAMTSEQIEELNANPPSLIVDPKAPQIEAVRLLEAFLAGDPSVCREGDPYQPFFGANFFGPPGCGKTHIMTAFAKRMKDFLDEKLKGYLDMVTKFVKLEYVLYQRAISHLPQPDEQTSTWTLDGNVDDKDAEILEAKSPIVVFQDKLKQFKEGLARLRYQPSDLLYLDFESLWELCRGDSETREQAFDAIIRAKVLFLDDVHPKGDIERLQIVLHVIEGRYAAGRMGTFITTNLTTDELAGKGEEQITARLKSRCSEMFYEVEFKDCVDWRSQVKQRRINLVREQIRADMAGEMEPKEEVKEGE